MLRSTQQQVHTITIAIHTSNKEHHVTMFKWNTHWDSFEIRIAIHTAILFDAITWSQSIQDLKKKQQKATVIHADSEKTWFHLTNFSSVFSQLCIWSAHWLDPLSVYILVENHSSPKRKKLKYI